MDTPSTVDRAVMLLVERAEKEVVREGQNAKTWVNQEEANLLVKAGAKTIREGKECGGETFSRVMVFCGLYFVNAFMLPGTSDQEQVSGQPC